VKLACPRIMVAGTHSGVGKTSVTLALVSALARRGLKVQTFKVGPDYLDPTYLTLASGRPCYNLDGWMAGKDHVASIFREKASSADVAVIEGVMGLFDGSDPVGPEGSSAEIASWLQAPVLLVTHVHGLARSIAPMVRGFAFFDPNVLVAGVIANRCGSQRHGEWLSESLAAFNLPPAVAAIPRGAFPDLPSRHLGLVTADSRNLPESVLSLLGDTLERFGEVDKILEIARNAPPLLGASLGSADAHDTQRVRVGIAYDAAFHFYYQDNLEALEAHGCELVRFSPLKDRSVPVGLDGMYIGGGYPEEYADELAENRTMREDIRKFSESGRPLYAECGGLMYLSQGIESRDGTRIPLVGLLPFWTKMLERLKSLGYVEFTLSEESLFGKAGDQLRGHEFHYSEIVDDATGGNEWHDVYRGQRRRSDAILREGFQRGQTLASYVHVHFASRPHSVGHFVSKCLASRKATHYER
jgi:cobyrinic acid a,c-diamide synthase